MSRACQNWGLKLVGKVGEFWQVWRFSLCVCLCVCVCVRAPALGAVLVTKACDEEGLLCCQVTERVGLLPVNCQDSSLHHPFLLSSSKWGKQWSTVVSPDWHLAENLVVCHSWPPGFREWWKPCYCCLDVEVVLGIYFNSFVFLLSQNDLLQTNH